MARLTRVQQQELNRRRVLAAARAEFSERGFRKATVDEIAIRADLTRGAVHSPSTRNGAPPGRPTSFAESRRQSATGSLPWSA